MKFRSPQMLTKSALAAGLICFLCALPSVSANNGGTVNTLNSGNFRLPDSGASYVLFALGCSGLAVAARKRFKRS